MMLSGRALGPGKLFRRALPRGGVSWTLSYTDSRGKRRRLVLGSDRRVAERRRVALIAQRDLEVAGLGSQEGQSCPLSDVVDAYLGDLRLRATPRHVVNVEGKLRRALAAFGAIRVRDLVPHMAIRWRAELVAQGAGNRTANAHVDALRAALGWAINVGLTAANPLVKVPRLPEGARHVRCRRRVLSEAEIARYLAAAEADDREQIGHSRRRVIPQAPLWRFLLESGCRYGEAATLSWGDVDLASRLVTLRGEHTKSGRSRVIPLSQTMTLALLALGKVHERVLGFAPGAGDVVFLTALGCRWPHHTVNVMRVHDRLLAKAEIARVDELGYKVDLHSLRHTSASRFARSGVPLVVAQRILGHSTPVLTAKHYVHLGVEELREAVEGLPDPARPREAATRAS